MQTTTEKPQVRIAQAIAAGLFVLFLIGLAVGLPVIVWMLWLASVVGYLVATREIRAARAAKDPRNQRPWHNR